jgi:hypothetical protein
MAVRFCERFGYDKVTTGPDDLDESRETMSEAVARAVARYPVVRGGDAGREGVEAGREGVHECRSEAVQTERIGQRKTMGAAASAGSGR